MISDDSSGSAAWCVLNLRDREITANFGSLITILMLWSVDVWYGCRRMVEWSLQTRLVVRRPGHSRQRHPRHTAHIRPARGKEGHPVKKVSWLTCHFWSRSRLVWSIGVLVSSKKCQISQKLVVVATAVARLARVCVYTENLGPGSPVCCPCFAPSKILQLHMN